MKPYHPTFCILTAFALFVSTASVAGGTSPVPASAADGTPPSPIVPGNAVYPVNGYWVTAPSADASACYVWSYSRGATAMDKDPCSGHGNWRMPAMRDFSVMAGWQASCPWTQESGKDIHPVRGNRDAWSVAFPNGVYLSSSDRAADSHVWAMYSDGNGKAGYTWDIKRAARNYIRCVQGGEEKDGASVRETIEELINYISNTNNNE